MAQQEDLAERLVVASEEGSENDDAGIAGIARCKATAGQRRGSLLFCCLLCWTLVLVSCGPRLGLPPRSILLLSLAPWLIGAAIVMPFGGLVRRLAAGTDEARAVGTFEAPPAPESGASSASSAEAASSTASRGGSARRNSRGELELQVSAPVAAKIQQLNERSRICTRRVWEEMYLAGALRSKRVVATPAHDGTSGEDAAVEEVEELRPAADGPSSSECCICLGAIGMNERVRGLACGHVFHLPCIAQYFVQDTSFELCCPLCRVPLAKQGQFLDF